MQATDISEKKKESSSLLPQRRLPVGAEPLSAGGVHFRVWASDHARVEVALIDRSGIYAAFPLQSEPGGYFSAIVNEAQAGTLYKYRLDSESTFPDPVSRFQPEGPHGPSQVIDPSAFQWTDHDWPGVTIRGQVIYELHLGTFTSEGTYKAAISKFPHLKKLGVSVLEIMPVGDFSGNFGWGYDGVNLFAPTRLYGGPDDLRHFVDEAHKIGLAVILDVVYNHLGPDGNYLARFSRDYFSDKPVEWGEAINFDGRNSKAVREFYVANAGYWVREFHMDGLRLDATQSIFDSSENHVLAAITRSVRAAGGNRSTIIVAENESQHTVLARTYGIDALWNDDFHHSAIVALTGRREAYYSDHFGAAQEFISAAKHGYLFQGQYYSWQKKRRGTPAFDMQPYSFVTFIENHDQVANSGRGARLHQLTSPGRYRAMTALFLLLPGTPMLFQGQEFLSSAPFLYFADHQGELAQAVSRGRKAFLAQFLSLASPEMYPCLDNPEDERTFKRCKLDWAEAGESQQAVEMVRELLKLRREDPAFNMQEYGKIDGAVLGPHAFVLRYFVENDQDRLLIVNFGIDLELTHLPEPLLAPPEKKDWKVIWSSEYPRYGGSGTADPDTQKGWRFPGETAVVLAPAETDRRKENSDGKEAVAKN